MLFRCHLSCSMTRKQCQHLLGQYFQPRWWTRCFISEEPSHECCGPWGIISCWHPLHHIKLQPLKGHFKFRASLSCRLSKKLEELHLSRTVKCRHSDSNPTVLTCGTPGERRTLTSPSRSIYRIVPW